MQITTVMTKVTRGRGYCHHDKGTGVLSSFQHDKGTGVLSSFQERKEPSPKTKIYSPL